MLFKIAVLKNFAIFTKLLESLFNIVAGLKGISEKWDPKVGPSSLEKLLRTFTDTLNPESTTKVHSFFLFVATAQKLA